MILVLIAAAVVSGLIGDLVDTLAILVIVVLNAAIGVVQAWRADRALAALQATGRARRPPCVRGGAGPAGAGAASLVPGDVVLLEAGNQVPADLRLIEIAQLQGGRVRADRRVGHGRQACRRARRRRCMRWATG